jgi:hypothetical protein
VTNATTSNENVSNKKVVAKENRNTDVSETAKTQATNAQPGIDNKGQSKKSGKSAKKQQQPQQQKR